MPFKEIPAWRGFPRWQPARFGLWLALLLLTPAGAHAQRPTASETRGVSLDDVVRVVIKSPCFDSDTLSDEIEGWLGRDTVDGRIDRIQIRASQGLMSFSIDVQGHPPTTREFPELPRDCQEQRGAIALSIALAVDALEADLPAARPVREPPFQVAALGTLTTGIPSSLGLGVTLSGEWRPAEWLGLRVGITGIVDAEEQRLRDGLTFSYRAQLLTTRLESCIRAPSRAGWEIAGCAGLHLGSMRTVSGGQFAGEKSSHGWYAATVGAEVRLIGDSTLGLMLGVDLIAPLRTITIAVLDEHDNPVASRQFPRVLAALRLGPTLSF